MSSSPAETAHSIFIVVAIELLAVGIFTLIAGVNTNMGKFMVILMVGFWLIYVVTTSAVISNLGNALGKVADNAS